MSKYQTKREEGFTIIEVLIVLAIAGLIMLVVFLAVPNLQRNSRNNQYRSEASSILGAYSEVSSNKNGARLAAGLSSAAGSDAQKVFQAANPQNITSVRIEDPPSATAPTLIEAVIRTQSKCTAADSATTTGGSSRQVALLFMVETPGGTQVQCQSS